MGDIKSCCCQLTSLIVIALGLTSLSSAASKLTVSPMNPRQLSNSTLQFTASANGEIIDGPVTWTSSNKAVAAISGNSGTGTATLLTAGTTTITAAHGGRRASTTLTVTAAASPTFSTQPSDTNVSSVINGSAGGVKVRTLDNLGGPLTGQIVTISIGTNPPGTGTLSGTLTQATDATGTATFPDLKIDWLGTGYTLAASARPSSGPVAATSNAFNELRVGNVCLGPDTPACGGTCPDADGDGLNDAWEQAGGVDLNGDGVITDSAHDLLLTGADPNHPDIFVQYDWMDYGPPGNACSVDTDCTRSGLGHKGETCTGPQLIPSAPASCRYSCNVDSDCTSRSAFPGDITHAEEKCQANTCVHTHDPSVTSPGALQAVVDRFAAHDINLHLIRGHAQPHSTVLSFRLLADPANPNNVISDQCEGGSLASGDAGPGKYAESFYDLKANSSPDKLDIAYHYTIFGHYPNCDSTGHCNSCLETYNPDGSPKTEAVPSPGSSGLAEISGNDFMVTLGNRVQDLALSDNTLVNGGTFMHELGHNLGLHHGGGIDEPCQNDSQCRNGNVCTQTTVGKLCLRSDDTNYKPNFLSVMNYKFQFTGIEQAVAVGSTTPMSCSTDTDCPSGNYCSGPPVVNPGICSRLDYSAQTLPTGGNTPGLLEERNTNGLPGLSEPAGLGSGTADLTSFFDSMCDVQPIAPTDGPVDWSGNGDFMETNVAADLNAGDHTCGTIFSRLGGSTDWPELSGFNFTYGFQCTPFGGPTGDGASAQTSTGTQIHILGSRRSPKRRAWNVTGSELSPQMAMDAHILFPIRAERIMIRPGCSNPAVAPGQQGTVQVALLGNKTLDVNQVDLTSLHFHGAAALTALITDVDGDGQPDLLATFDMAKLKLGPNSSKARLSGWLKNSQAFFAEDNVRVVPNMAGESPACR